ncbi:MAG: hypothetical protein AAF502_25625 [Bacteroidota bacterium]
MSVIEALISYFRRTKANNEVPEGFCPNCWGKQEYEGKFLEALNNEKIDLNNIDNKKGWIQAYATRNFEGIKIDQSNDLFECPTCKLAYRPS